MQPPTPEPEDRTSQPSFSSSPNYTPIPPPPPGLAPQGNYPEGEESYYQRMLQSGTPFPPYVPASPGGTNKPASPKSPMRIVVVLLLALILVMGATIAVLIATRPNGNAPNLAQQATATQAISTSAPPTQAIVPTPTEETQTATPPAANDTPTAPPDTASNYQAPQPGPGCDTNGGKWTSQGLTNISCGTNVTVAGGSWAYLYFQLPNNQTFLSNNAISIDGGYLEQEDCLGLAELGNGGKYLVAYCGNGQWSIYSLSNIGATAKELNNGLTSTRDSEDLSLTLNGTTLSFGIDSETYTTTVSSFQPVKVAIGFFSQNNDQFAIQNFSYNIPATS